MNGYLFGRPLRAVTAIVVAGLVLVSSMVAASAFRAAASGEAPVFGVQWHAVWSSYTDAQRITMLDKLAGAGARSVRIDVGWDMLQPSSAGAYDAYWTGRLDTFITMAQERGLDPLVTLYHTPGWANGGRGNTVAPANPQDFGRFAGWCAARWAGKVKAWEIWNEPNASSFLSGADPAVYAGLVRASYAPIKAADPRALVVAGAVSYTDTPWLTQMYNAGAAGYFDVLAAHPYQGRADAPPETADDGSIYYLKHTASVHDLMLQHGDGGKPIWFTEFGWSTHSNSGSESNWQRGVTEAQQADFLVRTLDLVRASYPYVTQVYWYNERDRTDADVQNNNYGLVHSDLSPKPALAALRSYLSPGSTSSPTPSASSSPSASPSPSGSATATPSTTPSSTNSPPTVLRRPAVGVQWHATWSSYASDSERARALDAIRNAGAAWIRLDVDWALLQPSDRSTHSNYWTGRLNTYLSMARARGLRPLVSVSGTPSCANHGQGAGVPPDDPGDYGRLLQWMAGRWTGTIAAYEIWDEPNVSTAWSGTAASYVALLRQSYRAVKMADPAAIVVTGGTRYHDDAWLRGLYNAGAKGSFDVVATHSFQSPSDLPPEAADDGTAYRLTHITALKGVMAAFGDGVKPIWLTELGWSAHANVGSEASWNRGVSQELQAAYLVRALRMLNERFSYVKVAIWYDERASGDATQRGNYGLLNRDLTPRPAYAALSQLLVSR